jgi:phospholipid/cholesterol/gamma-HCH transport system substrate-binding protein
LKIDSGLASVARRTPGPRRERRWEELFDEVASPVRNSSVIGRVAAVLAVIVAVVAVALIVFGGGSSYTVNAVFENASQVVSGDLVEVAGTKVGTVSNITITPDGRADLQLSLGGGPFMPLHEGTTATIREVSLSGVANRYVNLNLGPASNPTIPNHGILKQTNTTSEVDLDQLFNTLDQPTRRGLQQLIQGTARSFRGYSQGANAAWRYLNPAIAASSVLFAELNRDTAKFTRFITKSGSLVTDIAQRQADLSAMIRNLAGTTQALAAQHTALGSGIAQLPGFMRLANTTFVNLRSALGDLTPLVNASKPVAPKLQRLLRVLRPFAADAAPTVRDLAAIIEKPGADNDLIDLTKLGVPLAKATVRNVRADGKVRPGAFPESTISLRNSTPELAYGRPYVVDLTAWFESFSHPGGYDANGAYSRVAPVVGLASLDNGALNLCSAQILQILGGTCSAVTNLISNPASRLSFFKAVETTNQGDRCPGSMERGGLWYPEPGYACDPSEVPTGK